MKVSRGVYSAMYRNSLPCPVTTATASRSSASSWVRSRSLDFDAALSSWWMWVSCRVLEATDTESWLRASTRSNGGHTFKQRPGLRWPRVLKSAGASSRSRECSGDGAQRGLRCDVRNTAPAATFLHKKCTGRPSDCALLLVQLVEQAEPAGHVARGRGLQEEGGADRERYQGDRDLGACDAAGQEYARHGGRDDSGVAAPAQEDDLVARPPAAPVWKQAGQDGHRAGHKDKDRHHHETAEEVVLERVEGQVDA